MGKMSTVRGAVYDVKRLCYLTSNLSFLLWAVVIIPTGRVVVTSEVTAWHTVGALGTTAMIVTGTRKSRGMLCKFTHRENRSFPCACGPPRSELLLRLLIYESSSFV
jgi:hypothetical protein